MPGKNHGWLIFGLFGSQVMTQHCFTLKPIACCSAET